MAPRYTWLALALCVLILSVPASAAERVPISVEDGALVWAPTTEYAHVLLTVSDPAGVEYRRSFESEDAYRVDPQQMGDVRLRDGFYHYQVVFIERITAAGGIEGHRQSGTFEVQGSRAVPSPVLDDVILDDLIVDGSLCVGQDCVNGEVFGFETVRLKENNLRIRFQDTSSSASFPTNDWEITINDSANGGLNYFAVTDVNSGRVPFRIEAGARRDAVYLDDSGHVGFGTSAPVLDLHTLGGDTPTLRLDQDGSGGYSPYTWDMGANEANYFIRNTTGGSTLPFRIMPSDAVMVTDRLLVGYDEFADAMGTAELMVDGDVIVTGTVTEGSNALDKTHLIPVDSEAVLAGVTTLPLATWEWIGSDGIRHLGPMAQDFYRAFGLGIDETHIATVDGVGVALASIQALHTQAQAAQVQIRELEASNARLVDEYRVMAERLARIEALLEVAND